MPLKIFRLTPDEAGQVAVKLEALGERQSFDGTLDLLNRAHDLILSEGENSSTRGDENFEKWPYYAPNLLRGGASQGLTSGIRCPN